MGFAADPNADDSLILGGLSDDPDACANALDVGANVDVVVAAGTTLILHLIENQAYKASELLVSRGANVNVRDGLGSTPLHLAALHGRTGLARQLMVRGADRHALDKRNRSPRERTLRGVTIEWDYLGDEADRALKSTKLRDLLALLLSDGQPTQALLELYGTHQIAELFHPDRWKNRPGNGLELYEAIHPSMPEYWKQKQVIDLVPLRRAARHHSDLPHEGIERFRRGPLTKTKQDVRDKTNCSRPRFSAQAARVSTL